MMSNEKFILQTLLDYVGDRIASIENSKRSLHDTTDDQLTPIQDELAILYHIIQDIDSWTKKHESYSSNEFEEEVLSAINWFKPYADLSIRKIIDKNEK